MADGDFRSDVDPETIVTLIIATLGGIVYQHLLDAEGVDLIAATRTSSGCSNAGWR